MSLVVNNVIYFQGAAAAGGQVVLSVPVLGGGADGARADQGHLLHQAGGAASTRLQVTPSQGEGFNTELLNFYIFDTFGIMVNG